MSIFISLVFTNSENSNEQYTDHGGTDLLSFFKETLNKNVKDRQFLLKVEKDLIEFVQEGRWAISAYQNHPNILIIAYFRSYSPN